MPTSTDKQKAQDTRGSKRLGTTFHRTFWLSRPQIRQLLAASTSLEPDDPDSPCLTPALIREQTQLGTVQTEAMPRYAQACGLLDSLLCPTDFGRVAYTYDPLLELEATQWLMHYHISANHGYGPLFWSQILVSHIRIGNDFGHSEIADQIAVIIADAEQRELKPRDARTAATVFLRSYLEADALGALGLLEQLDKDHYRVLEPDPPSVWVFALALIDYWQAHYPTRQTINMDDLYVDGGLGDIFLMGGGRVSSYLNRLQDEAYVVLHTVAPPYQIGLLQRDPRPLLERLYAFDEPD